MKWFHLKLLNFFFYLGFLYLFLADFSNVSPTWAMRSLSTFALGEIQYPSATLLVHCVSDQGIGFRAHFSSIKKKKKNTVYREIMGEFLV